MTEEDAIGSLLLRGNALTHLVIVEKKDAATLVDVDRLRVDCGEHSLEGRRHELQRLVVLGEVVQHQHGRSEEGGLGINVVCEANRRVDSLAMQFENVAAQRVLFHLRITPSRCVDSEVESGSLREAADAHTGNHLAFVEENDVRDAERTGNVHVVLHAI